MKKNYIAVLCILGSCANVKCVNPSRAQALWNTARKQVFTARGNVGPRINTAINNTGPFVTSSMHNASVRAQEIADSTKNTINAGQEALRKAGEQAYVSAASQVAKARIYLHDRNAKERFDKMLRIAEEICKIVESIRPGTSAARDIYDNGVSLDNVQKIKDSSQKVHGAATELITMYKMNNHATNA
ncbi:hypothetical protein [Candidatus Cytomitobacter primus]|uniref:Uncharacterized protein n=1 Tax=Candidatus Cytomitobacter primus TaxID=2066024 RepID=A0A5C0UH15_9PROT|nr:hypothetical protein [Candidatus Cytomitobacter primus]QEK38592.1 hypothetical protein FZC34_01555 [Candidatus Cytomitobacter primus]